MAYLEARSSQGSRKYGLSLVAKGEGLKRTYLLAGGPGRGLWTVGWLKVRKVSLPGGVNGSRVLRKGRLVAGKPRRRESDLQSSGIRKSGR